MENCKLSNEIVLDFDDFYYGNDGLGMLSRLKVIIPNLKVNLFTIIGRCSVEWLDGIMDLGWVDLIPHGWLHDTNYECAEWTLDQASGYLDKIEPYNLTKGFRSPGWQTSNGLYEALNERGYWIADHKTNNKKWPKGMKVYTLGKRHIHGHIQNACGNGLKEKFDYYSSLKGDFKFIKEIIS